MTTVDETTTRASEVAQGLHEFADFIEANPDFLDVFGYHTSELIRYVTPDEFPAAVEALGGHRTKDARGEFFGVVRTFGVLDVRICTDRDAVCEQVQTGTRQVERKVVLPSIQEQIDRLQAEYTVTEVVDEPVYEWRCSDSILRPHDESAAVAS